MVSIVVIAYNEEKYIGRLLESIRCQDYKNLEVIVVDNYSKDNTVQIANSYAKDLSLRIKQKENKGRPARSRNYGAKLAKGKLVLFLDSDIVIPKDFLSKNIDTFRRMKLSLAFFDFKPMTKNTFNLFTVKVYKLWLNIVQYFNPRGIGSCLLVYKNIHNKVLFDETFAMQEDFDYIERAVRYGKFRIITKRPYWVSWRRFDEENSFILILKYLVMEAQRIFGGKVKKLYLPYSFGKYKKR